MSVAIVTDSTASLPDDVVSSHGIAVVPLHVVLGAQQYGAGVDIPTAERATRPGALAPRLRRLVLRLT